MNGFYENTIKEMLTVLPQEICCVRAFITAYAKAAGVITFEKKRMNVQLPAKSAEEAAALVGLLKKLYPADFEICVGHIKAGVRKGDSGYSVRVPFGFTKEMLRDLGLVEEEDGAYVGFQAQVPEETLGARCCAVSYLKGLYTASGIVYVPSMASDDEKKDGYHFEMQFDDECFSESVREFLLRFSVSAKTSERGSRYLVYVKDKEEILSLLAAMDLGDSVMTLQSIIDERETANSINRASICEAANLDKTFAAASRHLLAIGAIEDTYGLDSLSPQLLETARARMEYQQASLQELSEILGVTKSCLNHRLRKLTEIADGIEETQ